MEANQSEVSDRAQNAAEHVRDAVSGWSVTVTHKSFNDTDVIHVYSDEDHVSTNGYAKGSVINTVMQEVPSLVVNTTRDGDMAVSFEFKND
jgi:hypothetical protein